MANDVDLSKTDIYDGPDGIPDEHCEICLKVIRTIRHWALNPDTFNADIAVIFSHTHSYIVEAIEADKHDEDTTKGCQPGTQDPNRNDGGQGSAGGDSPNI